MLAAWRLPHRPPPLLHALPAQNTVHHASAFWALFIPSGVNMSGRPGLPHVHPASAARAAALAALRPASETPRPAAAAVRAP